MVGGEGGRRYWRVGREVFGVEFGMVIVTAVVVVIKLMSITSHYIILNRPILTTLNITLSTILEISGAFLYRLLMFSSILSTVLF